MKSKIIFCDQHIAELNNLLFDLPGIEGAAFILCGEMKSSREIKLISHAVIPVDKDNYLRREPDSLSISSRALMRITKLASYENLSIIFAHSHPDGIPVFSRQDDEEEAKLIPFFQSRCPDRAHGTVVFTQDSIAGRIYHPHQIPTTQILVIGGHFRIFASNHDTNLADIFDRQIRAFGIDVQGILSNLHIGIVGLGGTGSPLAEQLYRLGVGEISLFDEDTLDRTNINRVYGSSLEDVGKCKVDITKNSLDRIGLGSQVHPIPQHITNENSAKRLCECDVIFGCTDKQMPRAILTKIALQYLIPVFDLGVLIDSEQGRIRGVHGRVTTLLPGEACLFCRGRISPEAIRIEALSSKDRASQSKEGYAPELENPDPAVIAFTSSVASAAVSELLHRLTGYMGADRNSSEILYFFDESRIRTNRVAPRENCTCGNQANWGIGDEEPFLGMVWATDHTK